jgi:alpha-N-arabinofuranosidase
MFYMAFARSQGCSNDSGTILQRIHSDANRNSRAIARLCIALMTVVPAIFSASAQARSEAPTQLTIDATQIVSPVSPTLYGLMTEEINHSYDGGLYAEMIQNRTFHPTWEGEPPWGLVRRGDAVASRSLDKSTGPSQALPYSMRLSVASASSQNEAGLTNPGFWG